MPDDRSILEQHKAVNSLLRVRVKELEADNVRHLADLNQVRTERDKFRNVAAKLRKDLVKLNEELVDCRNKYDVLHSAHEDSKRDIAAHDAVSKKRKIDSEAVRDLDALLSNNSDSNEPINKSGNATPRKISSTVDIAPGLVESRVPLVNKSGNATQQKIGINVDVAPSLVEPQLTPRGGLRAKFTPRKSTGGRAPRASFALNKTLPSLESSSDDDDSD